METKKLHISPHIKYNVFYLTSICKFIATFAKTNKQINVKYVSKMKLSYFKFRLNFLIQTQLFGTDPI